MLKQASSIINLPIFALDTKTRVGQVYDLIVDPQTGRILAFLIKKKGIFRIAKILATEDIYNLEANTVVIEKADLITPPEEVVRAKQVLQDKIKIINNKVISESGTYLGKVENFVFDSANYILVKLYVKTGILQDLFKGELIIPWGKIHSITKDAIIVFDETIKEKAKEMRAVRAT